MCNPELGSEASHDELVGWIFWEVCGVVDFETPGRLLSGIFNVVLT